MTSSTVCLFGGTGFVGQRLAARLVGAGYDVRIPTRRQARHRELLVLPGVELIEADVHNEHALRELLAGAHAAINLIGILNEKGRDGSGFKKAHVTLVEKLVTTCQEQGVSRFLQMSALKANPDRGPSHYLRTKGAGEQVIRNQATGQLRYTIFQPSVIFGPNDSFVNRFARMLRVLPLFPLAKPDARFAPVFVDDVAEAFLRALEDESARDGTYQLCGPETYSLQEILRLTARRMGIKRVIVGLPDGLGRLQAWAMDYVPGKPFSMDNYRSLSVASTCSEDGLAALGITATSMEVVLPRYLGDRSQHRQHALSRFRQHSGR